MTDDLILFIVLHKVWQLRTMSVFVLQVAVALAIASVHSQSPG